MRKVFGIGETVFDIVFKGGRPVAGVPGGSTFNSIVSLGRCGLDAAILTEIGDDKVGQIVSSFLESNGVRGDFVNRLPCRTPISMAFLDDNDEAHYTFYRDKVDWRPDFRLPDVSKDDIVVFGSYYAVNPDCRRQVLDFLWHSKESGAILYYDVNFRPSHKKDLGECGGNIVENYALADVVRGSKDDLLTLYGVGDPARVYDEEISKSCGTFIFTDGPRPTRVFDVGGLAKEYPVSPLRTVSTIGAGDSFNAGFAYGLAKQGVTRNSLDSGLSEEIWDRLVECAQRFSADCCQSLENYVSTGFGQERSLDLQSIG